MPLGEALKEEIPGVVSFSRILSEECLFINGDVKFNRQKTFWVDEKFPEMFALRMIEGNVADALSRPHTMIISEEIAGKFFGNESPVGKSLLLNEGIIFQISGIFRKPEYPSHFDFDYLLSFSTLIVNGWIEFQNNWDTDAFYTYVKLAPNTDLNEFNRQLARFSRSTYVNYHNKNQQVGLKLQPVASIHLYSHLEDELGVNNRLSFIVILASLGLFTLLVSWLNFSGMVSSRYLSNPTSFLMNRVFGAPAFLLIKSMTIEIVILTLAAIAFSVAITSALGSAVYHILELPVKIYPLSLIPLLIIALLLPGIIFCSAAAGIMLFRMQPKDARAQMSSAKAFSKQQSALVVMQYSFSIFLIIFLAITFKQIHFLKSSDPGYHKNQVLVIYSPRTLIANPARIPKGNSFIDRLKQNRYAAAVCFTSDIPGKAVQTSIAGRCWLSSPNTPDVRIPTDQLYIDHGYFATLGLKLIAGKNFEDKRELNRDKVIINERAMKALGFDNPEAIIGAGIKNQDNRQLTICGVVSDFHQEGLQEEIKPMAFVYGYNYEFGYCAAKLEKPTTATLKSIQKVWDSEYPNDPFDYFFLDQRFNEQYRSEALFFRLCLIFGIIATLIACYGLFGISVETVSKRRKEIGIRKVNGATILEIMGLLNYTYVKLTLISFLIAFPFAYLAIRKWLESFAYKTTLSWWIFALSGILALGIALLTVSWQSWRAATRNPVEALRYE